MWGDFNKYYWRSRYPRFSIWTNAMYMSHPLPWLGVFVDFLITRYSMKHFEHIAFAKKLCCLIAMDITWWFHVKLLLLVGVFYFYYLFCHQFYLLKPTLSSKANFFGGVDFLSCFCISKLFLPRQDIRQADYI